MPIPSQKTAVSRLTAREYVYHSLRDWIVDGTLRPGEKIVDAEIADYFAISRTPVREALQLLAANKLVEIKPGKESRVTAIDRDDTRAAYELLAVLHCAALRMAFPRITAERVKELREINAAFGRAMRAKNPERMRECDTKFHNVFLKLCGNRFLVEEAEVLQVHVLRVENVHYKYFFDRVESLTDHEKIIEALERGDEAAALEWTRQNWEKFGQDLDGDEPSQSPT